WGNWGQSPFNEETDSDPNSVVPILWWGRHESSLQPRLAASIAAMSIFFIPIIASKAPFASSPPAASASVSTRGVICQWRRPPGAGEIGVSEGNWGNWGQSPFNEEIDSDPNLSCCREGCGAIQPRRRYRARA